MHGTLHQTSQSGSELDGPEHRQSQEREGRERQGRDRPGEERPGEKRIGEKRPGEERIGEERSGEERFGEERPSQEHPGRQQPGEDGSANDSAPPHGSAAAFYTTPRGTTAAAVLRDRMAAFWPDLAGMAVLGLGYAEPYLTLWRETAYRCIAASPASRAPVAGGYACLVLEDRLPFPDLSFDRILLIHGVDEAGDPKRLLREVWRVLKDDGRILVAAPNRLGLWAHFETTPFGQGRPYSYTQIAGLLAAGMFRAERRDAALFVPPVNIKFLLRGWEIWEQAGHALARDLAGVILIEAVKDAYAALPTAAIQRRHVLMPESVPADLAAVRRADKE